MTAEAVDERLPTALTAEFPEAVIKVAEPLQRSDNRLVNKVHDWLREMIASGKVPPNTRLFQERLATSLGVSRTPLREALLRLEQEGFVYTVPGRGMFIRSLKPDQASDMYQVREVLEPLAARLACEAATDEELAKIRDIQEQHEREYPVGVVKAFRGNFALHTSLVEPCPNRHMYHVLRDIWDQNSALLIFGYYTHHAGDVSSMVAEHRKIVDAFVSRDSFTVERLLRQHIQEASESLIGSLNGLEQRGREK
jgi:DNA-binding GntR family transcriptional regulator